MFRISKRKVLKVRSGSVNLNFQVLGFKSFERAIQSPAKEIPTQNWIRSMSEDEVFWDIGANVGLMSLLAAAQGCHVVAFEPEPRNYENLVKNLRLVQGKCTLLPLQVGLASAMGIYVIPDSRLKHAGTSTSFISGQSSAIGSQVGHMGIAISPSQALELLPSPLNTPTHIKIDTDGDEFQVLEGLSAVLASHSVRSLMVEATSDLERTISSLLNPHGFELCGVESTRGRTDVDLFFERR